MPPIGDISLKAPLPIATKTDKFSLPGEAYFKPFEGSTSVF